MKILIQVVIFTTILAVKSWTQDVPTIYAKIIDSTDYRFKNNLEEYHEGYEWKLWSFPFRKDGMQTPSKDSLGLLVYSINDLDLTTNWTSLDSTGGLGKKFDFYLEFNPDGFYSTAYQFYGFINVFNGNCQSITSWEEFSRIKTMNVYYNDIQICKVELMDSWHFQDFDIGQFFVNKYWGKFLDAKYEIKDNDKLTFEIMEIYPGTKYNNTSLSEFLIRGAPN